ncbi:MAG: twin-arginine translocase subunit TatB [Proteobacteria bacterium]|nr:twin-arginine translocase subunit TatB [Pseudomonadota bacterium]
MFDIGFAELVIIAVVSLLVIGPERLPAAIRTGSVWLNKIRRGFNDIKQEVQQELHNDAVLQELRKTGEDLKDQAENIHQGIQKTAESLAETALPDIPPGENPGGNKSDSADDSAEKDQV